MTKEQVSSETMTFSDARIGLSGITISSALLPVGRIVKSELI